MPLRQLENNNRVILALILGIASGYFIAGLSDAIYYQVMQKTCTDLFKVQSCQKTVIFAPTIKGN